MVWVATVQDRPYWGFGVCTSWLLEGSSGPNPKDHSPCNHDSNYPQWQLENGLHPEGVRHHQMKGEESEKRLRMKCV